MHMLLLLVTIWCGVSGQPFSYPVLGTKRYHRAVGGGFNSLPSYYGAAQYSDHYQPLQRRQQYYPGSSYEHGYVSENGYYNYPRHEYHLYGMPTYRGEYKPTPYYYAPGASFNYYDDRNLAPNPLDDLHEEILQEDERERQQEMYPILAQENLVPSHRREDEDLTSNFLRNLIVYNRQMEAAAQLQEQQEDEQQQQQQYQQDQPVEYDDDYAELNSHEFEYGPQGDMLYDLRKYEKPNYKDIQKQIYESPTPQFPSKLSQKGRNQEKFASAEDEDEKQLKSLVAAQQHKMEQKNKFENQVEYQDTYHNNDNDKLQDNSYPQYDIEPEYDDSWINWDKRRSLDDSIKAFTNRKPSSIGIEHFNKIAITSTKQPSVEINRKEPIVLSKQGSTAKSETTSPMTTVSLDKNKPAPSKQAGQKEIVLPRPVSPAQHGYPSVPIMQMQHQFDENHPENNSKDENKRSQRKSNGKSRNIYDTIKKLLSMEQQLENSSSRIEKRFVSSEDSLVNELNTLKRRPT